MIIQTNKKLNKAFPTDAAWDIVATEPVVIAPKRSELISTGLQVAIPAGYCGILKSRSGNAVRGLDVAAGVIDSAYRGEVKVLLRNTTESHYSVEPGDRVAQMMIVAVPEVDWLVVSELPEADRGDKGFGSSGK